MDEKYCEGCKCLTCMFTIPEGNSGDCCNCEMCINGDLKRIKCSIYQKW